MVMTLRRTKGSALTHQEMDANFEHVNQDNIREELASTASSSVGTGLLGWLRNATSAVATTLYAWLDWQNVNAFEFMTMAQRMDVVAGTKLLDVTAACQACINAAITKKKTAKFPGGHYLLLGGTASGDGYKNGILIPFGAVNFDPTAGVSIVGDAGRTVFCAGSDDMIVIRNSRNNTTIKDITIDGASGPFAGSPWDTWGIATVPEDMTQLTTLVSNSFYNEYNVSIINCNVGRAFQPGPVVTGAESGGFFHNVWGGLGSANIRHVWFRKSTTWATDSNRTTRTSIYGLHLLRGNVGYDFEAGTEINLFGCSEELIDDGTSPMARPTARHVSANAANINFYGGYSEGCTDPINIPADGIVANWGYIPGGLSGTAQTQWLANVASYEDQLQTKPWTPVVSSSGGGAEGASNSVGYISRNGKIATVTIQIDVAHGTLLPGTLSVGSLPYQARVAAGAQGLAVTSWSDMTFSANVYALGTLLNGTSTVNIRKLHAAGASATGLTLAECADPIRLTIQGSYITE